MKKIILGIFIVFAILGTSIFFFMNEKTSKEIPKIPSAPKTSSLRVMTTFYPIFYFTSEIAKEHAKVQNINPNGTEPHDFEPTPNDIISIQNSDLFIVNGAGLEPWAEKMESLNLSKHITLMGNENAEDPHFWLDPKNAEKEVDAIQKALSEKDPKNALLYKENASRLNAELEKLHEAYQNGLLKCKQRQIITTHNAFSYLGARYGFSIDSISGLSAEGEPSLQHLRDLTKLANSQNIRFVFTEPLENENFANTLAKEANLQVLPLNPIEGLTDKEISENKNYFSLMRENLQNLKVAMECE